MVPINKSINHYCKHNGFTFKKLVISDFSLELDNSFFKYIKGSNNNNNNNNNNKDNDNNINKNVSVFDVNKGLFNYNKESSEEIIPPINICINKKNKLEKDKQAINEQIQNISRRLSFVNIDNENNNINNIKNIISDKKQNEMLSNMDLDRCPQGHNLRKIYCNKEEQIKSGLVYVCDYCFTEIKMFVMNVVDVILIFVKKKKKRD